MAGDLSAILTAVEARLTALGFKAAKDVFDFDAVPDSIIDKSFRVVPRQLDNEYILGQTALTADELAVFIAYKTKRDGSVVLATALDDRERIEKDVINDAALIALAQSPILTLTGDEAVVKYLDNYLVSKVVFRCDYIRSLT